MVRADIVFRSLRLNGLGEVFGHRLMELLAKKAPIEIKRRLHRQSTQRASSFLESKELPLRMHKSEVGVEAAEKKLTATIVLDTLKAQELLTQGLPTKKSPIQSSRPVSSSSSSSPETRDRATNRRLSPPLLSPSFVHTAPKPAKAKGKRPEMDSSDLPADSPEVTKKRMDELRARMQKIEAAKKGKVKAEPPAVEGKVVEEVVVKKAVASAAVAVPEKVQEKALESKKSIEEVRAGALSDERKAAVARAVLEVSAYTPKDVDPEDKHLFSGSESSKSTSSLSGSQTEDFVPVKVIPDLRPDSLLGPKIPRKYGSRPGQQEEVSKLEILDLRHNQIPRQVLDALSSNSEQRF